MLTFRNAAALECWLEDTDDGRAILERWTAWKNRQPVLVLCSADGWIEVYGERAIDVHCENKLYAVTPATADLAEQFLDLSLPRKYAGLYVPVKLRKTHLIRKRTATCELLWRERAAWLGCFKELEATLAAPAAGG